MQKTTKTVHELTWQIRGLHVGSSLSSQPSHAFCLDKVEKIDSNDPPLALYEKKYICLDLSVGCTFVVKNTVKVVESRAGTYVPRQGAFIPCRVRGGSAYQPGGVGESLARAIG